MPAARLRPRMTRTFAKQKKKDCHYPSRWLGLCDNVLIFDGFLVFPCRRSQRETSRRHFTTLGALPVCGLPRRNFFRERFERFFRESHVSSFCCWCVRITLDHAYITPVCVYPLQRCHAADAFRACVETWGVCLKEATTCIACHLPRMSWYTAQSGHRVRSSSYNAMLMVLRIVNLHHVVLAVNAQT